MQEIPWRIRYRWLLNEISSKYQHQASGQIFEDNVKGFSSTSDICYMIYLLTAGEKAQTLQYVLSSKIHQRMKTIQFERDCRVKKVRSYI